VVAQRESPAFDMFNNYPTWTESLTPGEEATLRVTVDPSYHGPERIGFMQKTIRITAGELSQPLAELQVSVTVVEEP
jgi:hypothetical protein